MSNDLIAVIGRTGSLGSAIARRLVKAACPVLIGSRTLESAARTAAALGSGVSGSTNADAAKRADLVIVTVPYAAKEATLGEIAPHVTGKILVDATVPLVPSKVMLRRLLKSWIPHYNTGRPHMALGAGVPDPLLTSVDHPHQHSRHRREASYEVRATPVLGGLHHEYFLAPAST